MNEACEGEDAVQARLECEEELLVRKLSRVQARLAEVRTQLQALRTCRSGEVEADEPQRKKRRRSEDAPSAERQDVITSPLALPIELWSHILGFLTLPDRLRSAAPVCRQLNMLVRESIRDGKLGRRDFMSREKLALRRLRFYAQRCRPLCSLDLSRWKINYRTTLTHEVTDYVIKIGNSLQSLSLRSSSLAEDLLPILPISLRSLDLCESPVSDDLVSKLTRLTGLTDLNLSSTSVTTSGLSFLAGLPRLRKLNIWSIWGDEPSVLNLPAALESIRMSVLWSLPDTVRHVKLDTLSDSNVGRLPPSLTSLSIFDTQHISKAGWRAMPTSLTRLHLVHIPPCNLQWLPDSLRELRLDECNFIIQPKELRLPPGLEVLDIQVYRAREQHVQQLLSILPRLRKLYLKWDDDDLTHDSLRQLKTLTSLRFLRLGGPASADCVLPWLPPSLQRLQLPQTLRLDEQQLRALPSHLLVQYADC